MRAFLIVSFALSFAAAGCAGDAGSNGGEDDDGEDTCADEPAYGDGTCDLDLACDAPDIDCYLLFPDQAAAQSWFTGIEELIAASELRPPRALLAPSDGRFARMRGLLDQGWEAYQQVNPVADLGAMSPELVVIEDPSKNAFVVRDIATSKVAFAVMVQTGLLDAASDDELIGIVMHELTHAIRLHVIDEVKQRIRVHYRAADGEPFGFQQADDPETRAAIADWRALAQDAGPLTPAALVGFPMPNGQGTLYRIFLAAAKAWGEAHADICGGPLAAYDQLVADVLTYYSPIDQTLHLSGVEEQLADAQNQVLVNIRDQCMAGLTDSYIDILADLNGTTPEAIRAEMADEDEALVDGKHFIAALATLLNDRRGKMRATESDFAAATGVAWDRARHYTTEEEADDATIPVLAAMGRAPDGIAPGLLLLDDEETQAACNQLLAADIPPYGADLLDDHHANCFRVWHVRELAASGVLTDGAASALRRPAPAAPARPARYRPMPMPPAPSDYIMY